MISPRIFRVLALVSTSLYLGATQFAVADSYSDALETRLSARTNAFAGLPKPQRKQITAFYKARKFRPLWIGGNGLNIKATRLFAAFKNAKFDALNENDYRSVLLGENWNITPDVLHSPEHLAQLETDITLSAILYSNHASAGRVIPGKVNYSIKLTPTPAPLEDTLLAISSSVHPEKYLLNLLPKHPQYLRLKEKYEKILNEQDRKTTTPIVSYRIIRAGIKHANVALLRKRMIETGDYTLPATATPERDEIYDRGLVKAVVAYQRRNHLWPDGAVGPKTLKVLNGPSLRKKEQIALNMERFRWLPKDLGKRHVFVNQPEFKLRVFDKGNVIYHSRVIVGKRSHPTPVFSDNMSMVVFNPSWGVPRSIATKEILPRLRRDPSYLRRHNMVLTNRQGRRVNPHAINWSRYSRKSFSFRIRQKPGRRNALGRVKFLFPNRHSIYLHDTPNKKLFSRNSRAFSHGCVRVHNPQLLAEVLLAKDKGWSLKRVNKSMSNGRHKVIKLSQKVPIHLTYFTTWVDDNGDIKYMEDIYGRDKKLNAALNQVQIALK